MASLLASRSPTPIAQLGPDLPDQPSRALRGQVTITWPFNSVTQTFAFLVAEPDVRLRRANGQVRVELHGPSAKAVLSSGLGGGDDVLISLEGAEWDRDESPGRPGARIGWQLRFSRKLALQVRSGSPQLCPSTVVIAHPYSLTLDRYERRSSLATRNSQRTSMLTSRASSPTRTMPPRGRAPRSLSSRPTLRAARRP